MNRQCPSCGDLTCSLSCTRCTGMPMTVELRPCEPSRYVTLRVEREDGSIGGLKITREKYAELMEWLRQSE